jgi:hypothetical protein
LLAHRAERSSLELSFAVLNRCAVFAKEDRAVAAVTLGCQFKADILAASQFLDSPQELFACHYSNVAHIRAQVNTEVYEVEWTKAAGVGCQRPLRSAAN